MNPPVFFGSAAVVVGLVLFATVAPEMANEWFSFSNGWFIDHFGWFYVLSATLLTIAALWLLVSPLAKVKLGKDDDEPEFSNGAWFAMLLAAGMGIGIVFFGVAEPVQHYLSPPEGEGETPEAMRQAMRLTFFHWGIHPWSIYAAFALPIAYLHFRKGLPLAPRSILYPILGDRINGWIGHVADIVCTVGTLLGVATSLGLGSVQINAGADRLVGVGTGTTQQILIIVAITAIATVSVVSGLDKGIRMLSSGNLILAGLLLVFVFALGPTVYILDLFVSSIGAYLQYLPEMSFQLKPGADDDWQSKWTLFYWSWWISWSPFVGVFVARISKGRTIREFIFAALLVPTFAGFAWFSVMGGTGFDAVSRGVDTIVEASVNEVKGDSFYAVLDLFPGVAVTTFLALLLILVFFVTSSDSGSFVDDMVTSGGDPHPPRAQRVFWAVSEGAVAGALLFVGGLQALRSAALTTGLPLAVFLLVGMWGFVRCLKREERERRGKGEGTKRAER